MSWQLDPVHSRVSFIARHMMISKVRGNFEKFSGTVEFDESNPVNSNVDVEVDVTSISTGEEQRDGHLLSPDFFDVENYPVMQFKSKRVEQIGENSGRLIGDLTIRDVTKEVALDVEYGGQARSPWGTVSAGFEASASINRKDWGLAWNQVLETGGVLVGDKIDITIEAELVKQPEAQMALQGA